MRVWAGRTGRREKGGTGGWGGTLEVALALVVTVAVATVAVAATVVAATQVADFCT